MKYTLKCLLKSLNCVVDGLYCSTAHNRHRRAAQGWTHFFFFKQLADSGEMAFVNAQKTKNT